MDCGVIDVSPALKSGVRKRRVGTTTTLATMRSALAGVLGLLGAARAYIPAQGTNQTEQPNLADASSLKLTWPPMGIYMDEVSYQLARTNSSGYEVVSLLISLCYASSCVAGRNCPFRRGRAQGFRLFAHTMGCTRTSWHESICPGDAVLTAVQISCDKNATNTSMEVDIFTSAQERGAVAAVRLL